MLVEQAHIATGQKSLARTLEDQRSERLGRRNFGRDIAHREDQFHIHRVVNIGAIEGQCADAALLRKQNGVVRRCVHYSVAPGVAGMIPRFM